MGAWTTVTIKNASGVDRAMRAWDESGAGTGPFLIAHTVAASDGTAIDPAQDGTDATGVTPPAGAVGIRGWLSGIYSVMSGALISKPYSIPEDDWSYAAAAGGIVNTTTAVEIKAAAGAGLRNYITGFDISAEALGTATEFVIRDGAGGSVIWRIKIGTSGLPLTHICLPSPIKSTAATLLEVAMLTASTTGAVYFNATGYVAP